MNPHILLSILIPGTPRRMKTFAARLVDKLNAQAEHLPVEVLYLLDNKRRSVGHKRQALLDVAKGSYVAFCDDDDDVANDYCTELCHAISKAAIKEGEPVDVITFDQQADIAGQVGIVSFDLGQPNTAFNANGVTLRNAWHVCAWRRDLAQVARFPDLMDGEDWAWAKQLCAAAKTSHHINKVLHYYFFRPDTTEATGMNTKLTGQNGPV